VNLDGAARLLNSVFKYAWALAIAGIASLLVPNNWINSAWASLINDGFKVALIVGGAGVIVQIGTKIWQIVSDSLQQSQIHIQERATIEQQQSAVKALIHGLTEHEIALLAALKFKDFQYYESPGRHPIWASLRDKGILSHANVGASGFTMWKVDDDVWHAFDEDHKPQIPTDPGKRSELESQTDNYLRAIAEENDWI
jgi:hypothetical protein